MSVFETVTMTPERLRTELQAWITERNLGRGVRFYTSHEWFDEKGESIGRGAVLHAVIEESPLCAMLNHYSEDLPVGVKSTEEELNEFLAERGFYWELGFVWSLHVSRLD